MLNSIIRNIELSISERVISYNIFDSKDKIVISLERKNNSVFIEFFILIKNLINLNLNRILEVVSNNFLT